MSSDFSESDNISSIEDIELTEFSHSDGYVGSASSADSANFSRWSLEQSETAEHKTKNFDITFLNTSNENHHEFNIERTSSSSVKGIAIVDLARTRRLSVDSQESVLIRKASSLEESSTRTVFFHDHQKRPSPMRVSSLGSLQRTLTRRILNPDPLEGPSTRRVSSLDPLQGPLTRRVSSTDLMEESSSRRVSPLDSLEGHSTWRVSSLDSLEGPSTRMDRPLDHLERHPTEKISSLDLLEEPSTRNDLTQDPLEGPSTRAVWFTDPTECPLTNISISYESVTETATNEPLNSQLPTEQNVCWLLSFLRRHSRQIRHSRFFPCLYVALLAIPCSAGYMGSKYLNLCGGCANLPLFLYVLGIFGVWIITIQIAAIISKRYFAPPLTGDEFITFMGYLFFPVCLFFIVEMFTLHICKPVFTPGDPTFCVKAFYEYAGYMNMIVPWILILLMLIHVPGFYDPAEAE